MGIGQATDRPRAVALLHTAIRIAIIIGIAFGAHFLIQWVEGRAAELPPESSTLLLGGVLFVVILAYAALIAIPFVPGVEIGVSLMMIRGTDIAPAVYLATVSGLTAAFLAGRYLSYDWLHRVLRDLHLRRACKFIERIKRKSRQDRLAMLRDTLPTWLRGGAINFRYVTLAVLINLPGNSLIGGGGGICLMAGLSRLFTPWVVILTIALAVLPVPALVWWLGVDFLGHK
ncbi:MAG: hypothetical protein V3V25_11055 [Paracoccaceae bacterium]